MSRKKRSIEPKWQTVEKVVALLEAALTPTAQVKHNVMLPVLGQSRRRQCDIVITSGEPPRQTITIVEVQDRKSRPNINTFHGWLEKMREVGAQHLICVSARGFPDSIKEEVATRIGPTVRLMTLQQLKEINIHGLIFGNFIIHRTPNFTLIKLGSQVKLDPQPNISRFEFKSDKRIFSANESLERYTVIEAASEILNDFLPSLLNSQGITDPNSYTIDVLLASSPEYTLYIHIDEQKYKVVSLSLILSVETRISKIPLEHFEYIQESIEGAVAWISSSKAVIDGKEVSIQVVFQQDESGYLKAAISSEGIQNLHLNLYTEKPSWDTSD